MRIPTSLVVVLVDGFRVTGQSALWELLASHTGFPCVSGSKTQVRKHFISAQLHVSSDANMVLNTEVTAQVKQVEVKVAAPRGPGFMISFLGL